MSLAFTKQEKLKSRKVIDLLFTEGNSFTCFPVKLVFLPLKTLECTKAAFAVPKRNFNKAVDRNRIKRKIREAYRLNKEIKQPNKTAHFALLFLYIDKDESDYQTIQASVVTLLKKLPK